MIDRKTLQSWRVIEFSRRCQLPSANQIRSDYRAMPIRTHFERSPLKLIYGLNSFTESQQGFSIISSHNLRKNAIELLSGNWFCNRAFFVLLAIKFRSFCVMEFGLWIICNLFSIDSGVPCILEVFLINFHIFIFTRKNTLLHIVLLYENITKLTTTKLQFHHFTK